LVTTLVHPASYSAVLKITDRGWIVPPHLLKPKITTTLTLDPLDLGARFPNPLPNTGALVIDELTHGAPEWDPTAMEWEFSFTVKVVTIVDAIPLPTPGIWVAARALINDIPAALPQFDGSDFGADDDGQANDGLELTTFDVAGVHYHPDEFEHNTLTDPANEIEFPSVNIPGAIPGPYTIGSRSSTSLLPTNASGNCTLRFGLGYPTSSSPPIGTKVTLSIEAMGQNIASSSGRVNMQGTGSFGRFTDQHDGGITSGPFTGGGGLMPSQFSFARTPADKRKIDLWWNGSAWNTEEP
jgi:hypothetical protein